MPELKDFLFFTVPRGTKYLAVCNIISGVSRPKTTVWFREHHSGVLRKFRCLGFFQHHTLHGPQHLANAAVAAADIRSRDVPISSREWRGFMFSTTQRNNTKTCVADIAAPTARGISCQRARIFSRTIFRNNRELFFFPSKGTESPTDEIKSELRDSFFSFKIRNVAFYPTSFPSRPY